MAGGDTNVFFVPYRPHSKSKKSPPSNGPVVSQQKHAAREYHRKAKLERLAKLNALHDRHARSTSVAATESQPDLSSRLLLPRNRPSPDDEDYDKSFAVFDAGTGQLDPFNACVPSGVPLYALDILDYATTKQWRVFSSSKGELGEATIKNAVLACAMQSPAAFWSIIFAGATHNAYLQRRIDAPSRNRTLRLSYKSQAIKELNREIQALEGVASDELLLAIITMAAHGTGEQLNPPAKEEILSPLEAAQNFQYYGRMRKETAHLKAVFHLVHQKGGLHTVKMPGLANAIGLADVFFAFQDLRAPAFPLLAPTSLIMSTWPEPPTSLALYLQNMTSGFQEFRDIEGFASLMQVISNARLITLGFDAYMSQHPSAPTLTRIVWARNFMTHDVLSLPLNPPTSSQEAQLEPKPDETTTCNPIAIFSPSQSLYSLIRLSTMAYTLLVLFPLPRAAGVHGKLSQQLMCALDDCTVLDLWTTHPKLLFWSTILGGIVSEDTSLRPWFAELAWQARTKMPNLASMGRFRAHSRSRSRSTSRHRSHSCSRSISETTYKREADSAWTIVRDICFRFLWFDGPECDGLGRAFWDEACENVPIRTRKE